MGARLGARGLRRYRRIARRSPWGAGLARIQPEMTYNATTFAAPVHVLFDGLLQPVVTERAEQQGASVTALHREGELIHVADRLTLRPLTKAGVWIAARLARMHHGRVTLYAAYIVVTLVVVLLVAVGTLNGP